MLYKIVYFFFEVSIVFALIPPMRNSLLPKILTHSMSIVEFLGKPLQQYFWNLDILQLFVKPLNNFKLFLLESIFGLRFRFVFKTVYDLYGVRE